MSDLEEDGEDATAAPKRVNEDLDFDAIGIESDDDELDGNDPQQKFSTPDRQRPTHPYLNNALLTPNAKKMMKNMNLAY